MISEKCFCSFRFLHPSLVVFGSHFGVMLGSFSEVLGESKSVIFGFDLLNDFCMSFQERPKRGQERPQTAPERPKSAQERPKSAPRAAKSAPRAPQERPKSGQERPKSGQEGPKSDPPRASPNLFNVFRVVT